MVAVLCWESIGIRKIHQNTSQYTCPAIRKGAWYSGIERKDWGRENVVTLVTVNTNNKKISLVVV